MIFFSLSKKIEEQGPDKVADFKKRISGAVTNLMPRHGEFQYFTGIFSVLPILLLHLVNLLLFPLMIVVVQIMIHFPGESMNAAEGMVAMCEYRSINGVDTPVMSFFKDGLLEEKV